MTNNIAIVFPGQGSQSVGMITELYEQYYSVRKTYQEANDALGLDLWSITKDGPAELLNQTINTQPAMLVAGVACWRVFQEHNAFTPKYFAGHSLGEYTALVASGQLEFADAVMLSKKRAESMQKAVPEGIGAMAAILGLETQEVDEVCIETSTESSQVWPANDNSPGQIVIAGHKKAIEQACEKLKEKGAKRALVLPVSVPSHCPLMQPAANEMRSLFAAAKWSPASAPVVHNADVTVHTEQDAIVDALTEQLIKPVRWVETVQYFAANTIDSVIEVGPGKVLAGLSKRIDKSLSTQSVYDVATLNGALDTLN